MSNYGSKTVSACVTRVEAGESIADVSRDTGVSQSAISSWCRDAGVKPRRSFRHWTTDEMNTIREMWASGSTHEEIAKTVNRSVFSIYGFARNHRDICPSRSRGVGSLKLRAMKLEQENARLRELLRKNGISEVQ